jgi:hypothetical protein
MTTFKIGALCSLINHPYNINNTNVKISALAQMTPPIMVISEILNPDDKFDTESGEKKQQQLKCIFYSHKTNKYESFWFYTTQLKLIGNSSEEPNLQNDEFSKNDINLLAIGIKYLRSSNITELKSNFILKQVVLKSCDLELGKKKTTFEEEDSRAKSKISAHLDFLPPVMTVIDVKLNDDKIKYDDKNGNQKKIATNFLVKCKWFNSNSSTFSEDFLPIESLDIIDLNSSMVKEISECISEKKLIEFTYGSTIILDSGIELKQTFIQPIELIFNHYKYKLKYYDFFKSTYSEEDVSKISMKKLLNSEDFVTNQTPRYDSVKLDFVTTDNFEFNIEEFYRITYKDAHDRISKRVIYVKDFIKNKVIIADCLLRNGEERHFQTKKENVLKIEELDQSIFNKKSKSVIQENSGKQH